MPTELLIALLSGGSLLLAITLGGWARWRHRNHEINHKEVKETLTTLLDATSASAVIISKVDGGGKGRDPIVGKGLSSTLVYEAFSKSIREALEKDQKPASYVGVRNDIPEKDYHMLAELVEKRYLRMLISELPDQLIPCQGKLTHISGTDYTVCTHCGRKGSEMEKGSACGAMIDPKANSERMGIKRNDVYTIKVNRPGAFYYLIIMYPEEEITIEEDVVQRCLDELAQLLNGVDSRLS